MNTVWVTKHCEETTWTIHDIEITTVEETLMHADEDEIDHNAAPVNDGKAGARSKTQVTKRRGRPPTKRSSPIKSAKTAKRKGSKRDGLVYCYADCKRRTIADDMSRCCLCMKWYHDTCTNNDEHGAWTCLLFCNLPEMLQTVSKKMDEIIPNIINSMTSN